MKRSIGSTEATEADDRYPLIKQELLKHAATGAPRPKFDSPFGRALQAFTEPKQGDDVTAELLDKLEQYLKDHPGETADLF